MSIIKAISENQAVAYNESTISYIDSGTSYGGGSVDNRQLFSDDEISYLKGVLLTSPTSAANVVIRDGEASGEVILTLYSKVGKSLSIHDLNRQFNKGMHVKLTGEGATCSIISN